MPAVNTVINYAALDGTEELFVAAGDAIWDCTYTTNLPNDVVPSFPASYVSYAQLTNSGNAYLVCCSTSTSTDPTFYNGVSWDTFSEVVGPTLPGEVDGVDPALWSHVKLYKRRLWFVQRDSLTAWYLPVDAMGGTAVAFPLDGVFQKGGYLYEVATWSFNANDGLAQKLVFRSSMGEIAVYSGDDPDAAPDEPGAFQLEALYYVSPPVGDKSSAVLGGDLIMLTRLGVVSMNALANGTLQESAYDAAVTRNISKTLAALVRTSEPEKWEIDALGQYNGVLVTIPGPSTPIQYFLNTLNGAWSMLDLPASCFGQTKANTYVGTADGRLLEYGTVSQDNVALDGQGGQAIRAYMFSAFNDYGQPELLKSMKFVRPFIQGTASDILFALDVRMDYDVSQYLVNPDDPGFITAASYFDSALWDTALWSRLNTTITPWVGVSGLGYAAAVVFRVATQSQLTLSAYQVVFEPGASI